MPFTGDMAGLGQLEENLAALSQVPSRAASDAAEAIEDLIRASWEAEEDPYGQGWEALEDSTLERWGDHKILDLTGELKDVEVRPMAGAGISVTLGAEYGGFHQGGTSRMPARPPLPSDEMPEAWDEAIRDACEQAIERTMR